MKFSTLLNVKIGKKTKLQNEYYKLTSVQNFQTTFLITFDSFKDTYAIMNIIKNFCSQAATRKRLSKRYGDFFLSSSNDVISKPKTSFLEIFGLSGSVISVRKIHISFLSFDDAIPDRIFLFPNNLKEH